MYQYKFTFDVMCGKQQMNQVYHTAFHNRLKLHTQSLAHNQFTLKLVNFETTLIELRLRASNYVASRMNLITNI